MNARKSLTKSSLSGSKRRLVETMQRWRYGQIEDLLIRDGNPVLEPMPRVTRDIKLGASNGPRPELTHADFLLRERVVELFRHFDEIRNGTVKLLEFRDGLPCRLLVEEEIDRQ